jgi:hypothetical protein
MPTHQIQNQRHTHDAKTHSQQIELLLSQNQVSHNQFVEQISNTPQMQDGILIISQITQPTELKTLSTTHEKYEVFVTDANQTEITDSEIQTVKTGQH